MSYVHNTTRFQRYSQSIATCGDYACLRIKFKNLDQKKFNMLLDSESSDRVVAMLTLLYHTRQDLDNLVRSIK